MNKRMMMLKRWNGKTLNFENALFSDMPDYQKFHTIIGIPHNMHAVIGALSHLEQNGELIVRTPNDYLNNTRLSEKLYDQGTITDAVHLEETTIWRFVKGNHSRKALADGAWKIHVLMSGRSLFLDSPHTVPFSDVFTIKTGAISGLDDAFVSRKGNMHFVTAQTLQTGKTRRMLFNCYDKSLRKHKKKLIARSKRFNDDNWWIWGKTHHISEESRVYVPCKTQKDKPFFHHDCVNYDNSVLAIFYNGKVKPSKISALFNKMDWDELGFRVGKRLVFNPKALEQIMLPDEFASTFCSHQKTPYLDAVS